MQDAINEKDYATRNLLQWFVKEPVEEGSSLSEVVSKPGMVADPKNGMYMIHREPGARRKV